MTLPPTELEQFRRAVEGASVLVSTHVNPDPDAIGSVLAAREMLLRLRANPIVVMADEVPSRCRVLPGAEEVVPASQRPVTAVYGVAVIVDAGSLSRIGDVQKLLAPGAFIVNVDHHLSNDRFGALNLVDHECASTAEVLYEICRALEIVVTPSLANNLFAGLLTDTGRFRYANTTEQTFRVAAELVAAGAEITRLTNALYFDIPPADILSMGAIYSTLELFADGRISTLWARSEHLVEDPDCVVDLAVSVRGVEVAALLSETRNGRIRVSLRSRANVNVAAIAQRFGGGGHEKAAGFRMRGTLESVRDRFLPALLEVVGAGPRESTVEEMAR